jgi:hypothetical protein
MTNRKQQLALVRFAGYNRGATRTPSLLPTPFEVETESAPGLGKLATMAAIAMRDQHGAHAAFEELGGRIGEGWWK